MRALIVAVLLVLLPGAALAQTGNPGNPGDFTNNPHPSMPWTGITNPNRINYGQVIRYIAIPPQPVEIEVRVPTPAGLPPQTQRQVVEIPGYYIAETTTGYYYPERWTLEQLNLGVYQWRQLPPEFRRK